MKKVILAISVCCECLLGFAEHEQVALKKFLLKAARTTLESSFYAEDAQLGNNGKIQSARFYQIARQKTSGEKWFSQKPWYRIEDFRTKTIKEVTVSNSKGLFYWVEKQNKIPQNTIIRSNGFPRTNVYEMIKTIVVYSLFINIEGKYTIQKSLIDDKEKIKLTVKYPVSDDSVIKIFRVENIKLNDGQIKKLKHKYVSLMEFIIGSEEFPFIYSCKYYNFYGALIYSLDFGKIQLLKDKDLIPLHIPANVSVVEALNRNELIENIKKLYR